jgi:hypothetical protein
MIIMEKGDIDTSIQEARNNLRMLYEKYGKELYEISLKIDKYLEALQNNKKEEVEDGSVKSIQE